MNQQMWDILSASFWPILKAGLTVTLPLSILSFFFGLIIAILAALVQYAKVPILKKLVRVYVWLIRGTPLLVQLMIIFYGLPLIGIHSNPFIAATVSFSICEGAYMSETIRGALESIPHGQSEAGYCVGMNFWQVMWYIVLPQAFRTAFPALSNSLISLVKDSSLAAHITVVEMFMTTQRFAGKYYIFMPLYIEVALLYLVFCTVITFLQSRIEKRLSRYERKEA
ncbi:MULTISPECIES: amino acid ABC transporter permease [Terrabacteria group]|uniref:amino acid ABC transporter permease n=1 Tax=Bacillati TaxID=1783272 RepID=UPI001939A5C5|nr:MULTISPECIES: amino acid ABC transporter permease [Terrabacteria group]MBW9212574.1 amino acid ABC transporter permease [Trueperella sp. zg.1013]QRG86674.1 amino acid ABC transporter permease [Bulleidia sp. zg-1006]